MCGEHASSLSGCVPTGGIIPACAGSTRFPCLHHGRAGDHPRMCGEHFVPGSPLGPLRGSSPHVRGALVRLLTVVSKVGIIPACAGSTIAAGMRTPSPWDHPRMCGEHDYDGDMVHAAAGSSPHVRGAPACADYEIPRRGIIPACAGSTFRHCRFRASRGDHPRMCGEHGPGHRVGTLGEGSSPHVRGARRQVETHALCGGIIPACAGSTLVLPTRCVRFRDHPRMCGEHETEDGMTVRVPGSSPHVRGALRPQGRDAAGPGIIPACAGSTGGSLVKDACPRDHPRMCGEHHWTMPCSTP